MHGLATLGLVTGSVGVGGGVGKYPKARTGGTESTAGNGVGIDDSSKKRKVEIKCGI